MILQASSRFCSRYACTLRSYVTRQLRFSTSTPRRVDTIETAPSAPKEAAIEPPSPSKPASRTSSAEQLSDSYSGPSTSADSLRSARSSSGQLLYHVSRTPSNNLPVYTDIRNGRTRKETIIRKIAGDPRPLRDAIRELLGVESDRVWVGKVTGHVYVKGHHKPAIERFLAEKGF